MILEFRRVTVPVEAVTVTVYHQSAWERDRKLRLKAEQAVFQDRSYKDRS